MRKSVLFLTLLSIFGASFAGDADEPVAGGFTLAVSAVNEEGLNNVLPTVHTAFSLLGTEYPEFDYILKRVVSGTSQIAAGKHFRLKVEVTPKDHADQVKNCEIYLYENLQSTITEINLKCENDSKEFVYDKE